jgi:hypothetical protein
MSRRLGFIFLTFVGLVVVTLPEGQAQQQPQSFEGAYRGTLECWPTDDPVKSTRTQLAIIVRHGRIIASTQEIVAAVASGTVNENGEFRLGAIAFTPDGTLRMTYTGTLSAGGGTLTGTQVWTRKEGATIDTRSCKGTFISANEAPRK